MSQENVELVLDGYPRFNAGEPLAPLVREYYHADAEYHVAREDPDSAIHRGVAAITKQMESWIDAYPDLKLEVSERRVHASAVLAASRQPHSVRFGLPTSAALWAMKRAEVRRGESGSYPRSVAR